jgi:GT2 family glycosyltransferase
MAENPLLSVIIPNWNGARFLPECLSSLREQTYKNFEVILVDNASQDESLDIVKKDFPEVRVLPLDRNYGFAVACNRGAERARGDVIVLLNNDTETDPSWLEEIVKALREHPEAGSIASKILLFDRRNIIHSTGDMMGRDGIPINRGVWEEDKGQYDLYQQVFSACGAAAAYRRDMWEELRGFDEDLFMYLEDVDLAWRAQLRGWKTVFAPKAKVYHHLSATGGGPVASFYTGRNTILVIVKDMPGKRIRKHWRHIVGAQVRIAWDALRASRGDAARARLRGQLAAFTSLPKWLRKRAAVQKTRKVDVQALDNVLWY